MKFNKPTSVLFTASLFAVVFTTACSTAPTEKEDTNWIYESVENYNKRTIRQNSSTIITETKGGTQTQESLTVYDSEKEIAYTESSEKEANNNQYRTMVYYYVEDGQGFVMMKTVGGGATSSEFRKSSVDKAFIKETMQSAELSISKKATLKIEGEEKVENRETVKVKVFDPEYERLLDKPVNADLYKSAKETGKHPEELAKAYEDYVNMKEKEWTIWFDKETHEPVKTETDSSVAYNLLYYITLVNVLGEDQAPSQRLTTSYIISEDACEKIELPTEYTESK